MSEELENIEVLIIGSGPAGYTAAIYAARADLKPVLYQGLQPGGQLTTTTEVDNYPGYPQGVDGTKMMEDFKFQAERFETDTRWGMVSKVDFSERPFKVEIDEKKVVLAQTVIICTGASAKWLGIPDEERLNGFGVSACAVCDGFFYKGEDVVVVGAGDTAAEEATYLAKLCTHVTMLVRRDEMRASKAMQKKSIQYPKYNCTL
jgi:thioredoxin reductase (NADPH)